MTDSPDSPDDRGLTLLALIAPGDLNQIKLIPHQAHNKTSQVIIPNRVMHRKRKELQLVDVPGAKVLAYEPQTESGSQQNANNYFIPYKLLRSQGDLFEGVVRIEFDHSRRHSKLQVEDGLDSTCALKSS